jgi:predicted permease
MRTLIQDLRFGLRLLSRSPGFTAVAIFTLAIGIAANTTVFSWIDKILLRPFPGAAGSARLAVLESVTPSAPNGANQISYIDYLDYRHNLHSLSGLTLHREDVFTLGDSVTNSQAVWGEMVAGNYFSVLGLRPELGRLFTPEEDGPALGAYPVAVISDRLWRSRFHSNPSAIGQTFRVNRRWLTIAGVTPPGFGGTMPGLAFDIWVPVTMGPELSLLTGRNFTQRGDRKFYSLARLAPGFSIGQARAEALTFSRHLQTAYPGTNRAVTATVLPVWQFHSGAPELLLKPLRILMAICVLVLLIVCANVANLLLARSIARRKELSIRLAIGASGGRLGRQLFTETLLLALGGALAGLLLSTWTANLLAALVPHINAPVALGFRLSGRVLVFTMLTCVLATLFAGAAPALYWLRSDVNTSLKEAGRGGSQAAHSHRTRNLLVVAEVALATVALAGAGLFLRSFINATRIDPGFNRNNVVLTRFYLGGSGFTNSSLHQFCADLRDRLRALPGVTAVTYSHYAPLGSSAGPYDTVDIEGYAPAPGESMNVNDYLIAPDFFATLQIPLLEGRDFRSTDDASAPPVLIVNQSFVHRYFHGKNPIGRKVRCFGRWATVIGVAKNSKYFDVTEAPRPHFFFPYRQQARVDDQLYFYVRTAGPESAIESEMSRQILSTDPNMRAFDVMPLLAWTEVTLLPQKVAANLLAALGLVSLILAAVGLYSVMAYSVTQRTQEFGVRMALGAEPGNILAEVLRRGAALTASGLAAGLITTLAAGRLFSPMLVYVTPYDPLSLTATAAFLAAVALLASYLPARRATQVDPILALRCE